MYQIFNFWIFFPSFFFILSSIYPIYADVFTSLRDFTNSVRTIKSSYDYIVIGGGGAGCALARTLAESKYSVLLIERGGTRVEESDLSYDVNGVGRVVDDERVSQLIVTKQGIRTHVANVLGGGTSINMGMIMQEKTDFFKILKDMSGANLNYTLLEESHDWILKKVSNKGDQNLPIVEPLEESFNHINFVTPENPNSDFSVKRVNGTWRVYNIFNVTDNNFRMAADILLSDYESIKKDTVVEKSPVDILTHHFVTKIEFDRIESPKNNPRLRTDQVSFFQSKFSGISSLLNKQNNTKIFTKESTLKAKCIILNRNTFKSSYYDFNEHSKFNFTNEYTKIDMELINPYKSSKELIGNIIAKKICVNKNGMIILSAGSIHTPVLLYKSGIGPSEPLKKMNVMPLLEVENLGTSIVDRMLFAIPFFYKENVSVNPFVNPIMSSFSMKSVNCGYSCDTISIESLGGGRIIEGTLYATRLIFPPRLRNNIVTDFVMEIFKYCAENEFLSGILPICLLLKYPLKCLRKSAAIFYFTSEPKSRGNLTVKKNGTFELNANYLSDDEDRYNAVLGIKSVIKMIRSGKFDKIAEPGGYFSCPLTILNGIIGVLASAKTEGLFLNKPLTPEFMTELESVYNAIVNYRNTLYPEECFNAADLEKCIQEKNVIFERIATFPPILPDLSDEEAILNLAYNIGTSIWHWAGSVPLGELVENDSFILKGTKNLGVVDASLLKILPRVNPVHTVMSIGRYAGVSILRKRYENEENKKIY